MGYYPARVLIAEARRSGVRVLPLDINGSCDSFTVEGGGIRISLRQLKGMSEEALQSIIAARSLRKFTSLRDFVTRTNVSRLILENLVKIGTFDDLGERQRLLEELPQLLRLKYANNHGVLSLLPDNEIAKQMDTFGIPPSIQERLQMERELLSLDLSAHPLDLINLGNEVTRIKDLVGVNTGREVTIAGSVIRYQTPPTRNGNRVVYVIMEDGTGVADVTVFGDVQEKCGEVLFREGWLLVTGKVQRRGPKALSIIAEELKQFTK